MRTRARLFTAAGLLLAMAACSVGVADTVIGYNKITVPANSDVKLTIPFSASAEIRPDCATSDVFTVASRSGSVVSVSMTLTASKYAGSYYVRFLSGGASGLWTTVTANDAGSLTLENADVANLVSAGNTFRIYKHVTIDGMFPKGQYGVSFTNNTQLLLYDNNIGSMSQNKAASKSSLYSTSVGGGSWVGTANGSTILKPETQFILRNTSAGTLTVITQGVVPDYNVAMLVAPSGDLVIGTGYPVAVVLNASGLGGVNSRTVFFYDDSASGQNKAAIKTALYNAGNWVGAGVTGNELILPSQVITLRLPAGDTYGAKVTIPKPY